MLLLAMNYKAYLGHGSATPQDILISNELACVCHHGLGEAYDWGGIHSVKLIISENVANYL